MRCDVCVNEEAQIGLGGCYKVQLHEPTAPYAFWGHTTATYLTEVFSWIRRNPGAAATISAIANLPPAQIVKA